MRRLLLLRHAKAVPLSRGDDFDRSLTPGGVDDARRIGEWIAERGLVPDRCLYSGATRTRQTYQAVSDAWPGEVETVNTNALYEATRFLIVGLLRELPSSSRVNLVVGHNPGMADVANILTGEGPADARLRMAGKYPPGALAVIAFDGPDWSELTPGAGRLEHFVTPADL